ncbi:class I SAM-dependent methyltransferase [[Eubacterium] cellulosolvens]
MDLEKSYSDVYKNEPLGNVEIKIDSWPRERYEASIFFAGKGKRVLDVGCGNGTVLYNLREKFDELYGIELSKKRVAITKKTLKGYNAEIIQGNIEAGIKFEDEFFDVIICSDVIEHLVDVFSGFKEMTRLLKKNGKLVLNTPNVAYIVNRFKLFFGTFPSTSARNEGFEVRTERELFDGGHLHYFTFSMLEKMCKRFNYSSIERYGYGKHGKLHNFYPSLLSPSCQIVGTK